MVVSQYVFRAFRVVYRGLSYGVSRVFFYNANVRDVQYVNRRLSGVVFPKGLRGSFRVYKVSLFYLTTSKITNGGDRHVSTIFRRLAPRNDVTFKQAYVVSSVWCRVDGVSL